MRDPANTAPIPPRASPASRTCPSPRSAARAEITVVDPVHVAANGLSRSAVRVTLHDLGNPLTGRPREMILIYSQHCSPAVASISMPT